MPRTTDARTKAIETAERLFCVQGYAATGLAQLIDESGSPKGSFYFHFPGGKRELAMHVIETYRQRTVSVFRALAEKANGEKFVAVLADALATDMAKSEWQRGCVAQVLAQELAPGDAEAADALAALFDEWADIATKPLGGTRARAVALIAGLEGARTLARAVRSDAPFKAVVRQFKDSIRKEPDR
ncbi:MAG: TetR/AcrR family transcriptional regulator [Labilithrix sp.]|nr:TetR/AcrR family transcriptional regulator [Labilithrix sp.]